MMMLIAPTKLMSRFTFGLNKLLLVFSALAFGVCSLAAILLFFLVDPDAFAFDPDSKDCQNGDSDR